MNKFKLHKNTLLCILPTIGDTKDSKRIELLKDAGFDVIVAAYDRGSYISRLPDVEINVLGKIVDGKYFNRVVVYLKSFYKLRKLISKSDAIYAISPDIAFIASLCNFRLHKPLITDVADIREIEVSKSIGGFIVRRMDRFIAKRSSMVVVTSQAFIDKFYHDVLKVNIESFYLLENKVDYDLVFDKNTSVLHNNNSKIRIGYFGVLRDNWTIELFLELLRQFPDRFEILTAGIDSITKYNLSELACNVNGFNYLGAYRSPDDLEKLYKNIDMMAIFYPDNKNDVNWFNAKRICRSNRFYEACFFKKPILAFDFCADGYEIEKFNIGFTLSDYNIDDAIKHILLKATTDNIKFWTGKMNDLTENTYRFTDECSVLKTKINKLINFKNI